MDHDRSVTMFKPNNLSPEEQDARQRALQHAAHLAAVTGQCIAAEIVADAEKFAGFLLGTKAPGRQRGRPPKKGPRGRPPKGKA
jgi:hypothetical protein